MCVLDYGGGCRCGQVPGVHGTLLCTVYFLTQEPDQRGSLLVFFVCNCWGAEGRGRAWEELGVEGRHDRLCAKSFCTRLLLKQRRLPGLPAVMRTVPSQADLLTATLGGSPPLLQGASRTWSGCAQINTFSRCITPNSECQKTACILTSMHQPMRTPAPSSP